MTTEESEKGVPASWTTASGSALALLANVTVITALLVYFGWRRVETQARRLGFDEAVMSLSTQDYVVRSVRPVINILIGVALVGIAALLFDRTVGVWLKGHQFVALGRRRVSTALLVLAGSWCLLVLSVVVLQWFSPALRYVLFPAIGGVGILLLIYLMSAAVRADGEPVLDKKSSFALSMFGAILVLVAIFWSTSNYALVRGTDLADALDCNVHALPSLRMTSEQPLYLTGKGIEETTTVLDGKVVYHYDGVRYLEDTDGKLFVISDYWRLKDGSVSILTDDEGLRVDFVTDPSRDGAVYAAARADGGCPS